LVVKVVFEPNEEFFKTKGLSDSLNAFY